MVVEAEIEVRLYIPPAEFERVSTILGGVAAACNIYVSYGPFEPHEMHEVRQYNPKLVDWVTDPETNRRIGIVSKRTIETYPNDSPFIPKRLANALWQGVAEAQGDTHGWYAGRLLYFVLTPEGAPLGLRADKFAELAADEDMLRDIRNVGDRGITVMRSMSQELYVDPSS